MSLALADPTFTLERVDLYRSDFQQLLADLLWYRHDTLRVPELVPVFDWPIAPHLDELAEDLDQCWRRDDYDKAACYLPQLALGVRFPPLIVHGRGGRLCDGYHRLYCLRNLGMETYRMIDSTCLFAPRPD